MKTPEVHDPVAYDYIKDGKPFIFISYSHLDKKKVFRRILELQEEGFRIWFDKGIEEGTEWNEEIEKALNECSQVVFYLSKNIFQSTFIPKEMALALKRTEKKAEKRKKFIKIRYLDDLEGIKACIAFLWKNCKFINKLEWQDFEKEIGILERNQITNRKYHINRDVENLNLGCLPDDKEIENGIINLEEDKIKEKTKKYIIHYHEYTDENYKINNVFQLTSQDVSSFDKFKEIKFKDFKTNDGKQPINLLSRQLDISVSYVAPLKLLKGLITRLHQNWPPMIKSYQNLIKKDGTIDDLNYFIEYCWLAWGPSVNTLEISKRKERQDFMLLQVAYGDEANSVPLVLSQKSWGKVEAQINKGAYVNLLNLIVVNLSDDLYFKNMITMSPYFPELKSKKKSNENDNPIALYFPDDDECENSKVLNGSGTPKWKPGKIEPSPIKTYYSTSYIWLILEEVSEEVFNSKNYDQFKQPIRPGGCIPFFEHANLGSEETLTFLHQCLVRKAIYHVLDSKSNFKSEPSYLLSTALFPERIFQVFQKEKSKLNDADMQYLKKRLIVPEPDMMRSHADIIEFAEALSDEILKNLKEEVG